MSSVLPVLLLPAVVATTTPAYLDEVRVRICDVETEVKANAGGHEADVQRDVEAKLEEFLMKMLMRVVSIKSIELFV